MIEINPDIPYVDIHPSLLKEEGIWNALPEMIEAVLEDGLNNLSH